MTKPSSLLLLLLPSLASSFSVLPTSRAGTRLSADAGDASAEEPSGLILDDLDSQLGQVKSKYPTSEIDFLAAARARAAAKTASVEGGASDEDWQTLAAEKEEMFGNTDDWEESQKEAGNADSQILMFTETEGGEGDGEEGGDDEPKLLLF